MLRKMVNMARSVEEIKDSASPIINTPLYSYGLTLRFDQETMDKLNLDYSDVEVGDMLHMVNMVEVTSVSKHDNGSGHQCCIEMTVTHIGLENEDTEYGDEAE